MTTDAVPKSDAILAELVALLENMTRDWDTGYAGGIRPETWLINDLGFKSMDVVQLIVALEEHYGKRNLPFAELVMRDGRFIEDLRVGEVRDFLALHLQSAG